MQALVVASESQGAMRDADNLEQVRITLHKACPLKKLSAIWRVVSNRQFDVDLHMSPWTLWVWHRVRSRAAILKIDVGPENMLYDRPYLDFCNRRPDARDEEVNVAVVSLGWSVARNNDSFEECLEFTLAVRRDLLVQLWGQTSDAYRLPRFGQSMGKG
jgi:hypothetical protein